MGGTSTDVSVIIDGEPTISRSTEVGDVPGQGADPRRAQRRRRRRLDRRGLGSDQVAARRPAQRRRAARARFAYGRGGTEPAVSDANVVLGYLPPVLLGGDMTLDVEAARAAIAKIGAAIGLSHRGCGQGHHRHRQ